MAIAGLKIIDTGDMLNDAVAGLVPHINAEREVGLVFTARPCGNARAPDGTSS